jgi:hypothetical protein
VNKLKDNKMKKTIQKQTEELANMCLVNSEKHQDYSDEDLINATLIFTHFFLDQIYSSNQHLEPGALMELAETSGKAIRELIGVSTGKDMHDLVRNSIKK